jgi:3'-5' exoribonuclease
VPPNKPPLLPLHQIAPQQFADCFALLIEKTSGTTREGKPYFACKLRDKLRLVSAMIWADHPFFADVQGWEPGQFVKVRGTFNVHERYGPQIDIQNIRAIADSDRSEGFLERDYYESSRFDPDVMFAELRELVTRELGDLPLRKLVLGLLDSHAGELKQLPAHEKRFYPFPGGWLEHTLSVARSALGLVDRYRGHYPEWTPPLNRDLVLAGAVLHDIGRAVELIPAKVPGQPCEATVPGRLFGHIALGRDRVREAAQAIPELNPELLLLLEHLIQTHLALPEWGSPRLPAIPEVLILHHADDLDAKLEMYFRCLSRDTAAGDFTERDPLLGKPLLKRRTI